MQVEALLPRAAIEDSPVSSSSIVPVSSVLNPFLEVIWVTTRMGHRDDKHQFSLDNECNLIGEPGQIDTPVSSRARPPEKRMLDDRLTGALHVGAESGTEAFGLSLVVAGYALEFSGGFHQELQDKTHFLRGDLPQLGKDFPCGDTFRLAGLKAGDPLYDFGMPRRLSAGIRFQVHAVQELASQREALFRRKDERIVCNRIKGYGHGLKTNLTTLNC